MGFRNLSIAAKLQAVLMLGVATTLLAACVAFLGYDRRSYQETRLEGLTVLADALGQSAAAAIDFEDAASAEQILRSAKADPGIVDATLYGRSGAVFARWHDESYGVLPTPSRKKAPQRDAGFDGELLWVRQPVHSGAERVGVIYLRADRSALDARTVEFIYIAGWVLLGCLLLGFFVSSRLQRLISAPIRHIARAAQQIAQGDLDVRADVERGDEIGELGVAFNDMTGRLIDRAEMLAQQRRLEIELAGAQEAARAKTEFLATMSHEIRTPLNAVIGLTGLLIDTRLDAEQRDFVETVRSSADLLLSLINDILDFSKLEAGKLDLEVQDFDVRNTVENVLELLAEAAHGKQLELGLLFDENAPANVSGDPGRLQQVLTNLVANAVKFTEVGEVVVSVSLEAGPREDETVVLRFEVTDTGVGIPEALHEKLFSPFTQADGSTTRRYGGTGLGLAISKQIISAMGGEIGLRSRPDEGSTFWFLVPLTRRPQASTPPLEDLAGRHVLCVDDNETNRIILERQFAAAGMQVHAVDSGAAAFTWLEGACAARRPPDLIVVDIMMPEQDGFELTARIRQHAEMGELPIIALTSISGRPERTLARQLAIDAYLTKPVRRHQFLETVRRVLGLWTAAESRPTVSRVNLPAIRPDAPARLLIVEDNVVNQKVAVRLLGRLGYRADVAANGQEALDAVARLPYDAIFMDCQMPVMDGFEATKQLRVHEGESRRTPVIAMTANAMRGDRDRCLAAGMDDYIAKPVRLDQLQEALDRWLGNAPVPTPPPVIGWDVDALRELMQDEQEPESFLQELVADFLADAQQSCQALIEAAKTAGLEELGRIAHTLKSSSAVIGAQDFSKHCARIEASARTGNAQAAQADVERLPELLEEVRTQLAGPQLAQLISRAAGGAPAQI